MARGIGMRERIIITGTTFGHATIIGDTHIVRPNQDG
jgi:hypothetical protein